MTVELTPGDAAPSGDAAAVIVDVLRATSTLTAALAHGARQVLAAATPDEAFALKRAHPGALVCGERDGRKVAGFDLGNSPFEYGPEVVAGRTLVFASTNGSLAVLHTARAKRRVLGAFVNATAVVGTLAREGHVAIVCAGRLGRFSLEDALFAGWLCARLEEGGAALVGPAARLARALAPSGVGEVAALVQGASHARYLRTLGSEYAADVEFCSQVDTIPHAFEV